RQNDFGGVLGGPVFLPGYSGRNRTFFFFSHEGLRLRQPQVVVGSEVPSIALRQSAPPALQPYLNGFPLPNGQEFLDATGQPNGLAEFSTSYSTPSTLDATSLRIDHTIGARGTAFGRFNDAPSDTATRTRGSLNSPFFTVLNTRTLTGGMTISLASK